MVAEIISTITEMVTGLLGGLGTGIVGFFETLFITGTGLSSLAVWVIALLGLAVGLAAIAWVSTLIRGRQR